MAISQGSRQHRAYAVIDGARYPITDGAVEIEATRKNSTFTAGLPAATPGLLAALSAIGEHSAALIVSLNGVETTLIEGEIDTVDVDLILGTVTINGRDASAKLQQTTSAEKFINKRHDEIIKDIAGRVGLVADITSATEQAGNFVQIDWSSLTDGTTLQEVLHRIAEVEGFRWWIRGSKLVVRRDGDQTGVYPVTYSDANGKVADVTSLKIRRNIPIAKTIKVTGNSWNPRKKSSFSSVVTTPGATGTYEYGFHAPGKTMAQVTEHAKRKASELARHELLVEVECVGDPSIDPSMKLRLRGTSYFDQDYQIDRIQHSFGMLGYSMSIEAKSAKVNRGSGAPAQSSYKPFVPAPTVDPNAAPSTSGSQPQ